MSLFQSQKLFDFSIMSMTESIDVNIYAMPNLITEYDRNAIVRSSLYLPGEMAVVYRWGVGRIYTLGSVIWHGSLFYRTSSEVKIASTNNLVEVFETEIDTYGIFSEKVWEWK